MNILVVVIFGATYFFTDFMSERNLITDPLQLHSIIYKIDAENMNAPRIIYYMYSYKGKTFQGDLFDQNEGYQIGDTLLIEISSELPTKNNVLGVLKSGILHPKQR